jgi:Concanavalin A-like lectin/glucanases superfamily
MRSRRISARGRTGRVATALLVTMVGGLTSAATATPAHAAVDTGLVLGYGFERLGGGLVTDSSVSHLDGTRMGTPALPAQATGPQGHGKALLFDSAQQQFVNAGDAAALDVDHFTLAAWVRYTPNVHDDRWEILEKAGAYWMNIRTDTRQLRFGGFFGGCTGSNRWFFLDSKKVLPANTWVHVAGTYDGKTLRIFINGAQNATMAVTGTTCANTEPLGIGAKNRTATGVVEAYFDGRIDDLRVYNRALTAAEIKTVRTTALT